MADDQGPGLAGRDDVDACARGLRRRSRPRRRARDNCAQSGSCAARPSTMPGPAAACAACRSRPDSRARRRPSRLAPRSRVARVPPALVMRTWVTCVEAAVQPGQDQRAGDGALIALVAARHPRGERDDDDADGEEECDAACGHECWSFRSAAAGRRRRIAARRSAASANRPGITMILMTLSSVPSRSMSLTSPACTARSCLRMRSFSASKCSISCCWAGVRIRADLSLRFDCSSVSCCSVCCSCCCSCCSWAWKRASACRCSASHAQERPGEAGAAAHADQVGAAGQVVERVQHQIAVARQGLGDRAGRRAPARAPRDSSTADRCRRRPPDSAA